MKHLKSLFFFLFIVVFSAAATADDDIFKLLPAEDEVEGWKPYGTPDNYEGDDLFFLINGGADLYYEYGFMEVLAEHFSYDENRTVRIEIYRMEDPGAAFGIYSVSASAAADPYMIGHEGEISDYHIRFWKDNYYVIVSALDSGEETETGMKEIAGFIDDRIPEKGEKPEIVNYLPEQNFISAKYIRGNLAMMNVYFFNHDDIFGYNEAVTGDYGDFKLFVMGYGSKEAASENFARAEERMKALDRFSDHETAENGFIFTDNQGNKLFASQIDNHILLFIGTDLTMQPEMFETVEDAIKGVTLQ